MHRLIRILVIFPVVIFAQNSISGSFSPPENFSYTLLYKSTPSGTEYIDQGELSKDGNFTIELDSTVSSGIYKIVYASPAEQYNFDFIYNGKESINFNFTEGEEVEFTKSKENKLWTSYQHSLEMVNQTISNFYTKNSSDKKAFASIFKTLKDTQSAFEDAAEDMLVSTFIKSSAPYIPASYEDLSTYKNNLKHHYLGSVNFSNSLIQSSDFLTDRVMNFVFGMVRNDNKAYKAQVDILVNEIGQGQKVIKIILLEMVWRNFRNMENVEIANYVSDTYLLDLSKQYNYDALTKDLIAYKNNSIGMRAQDFQIKIKDGDKTESTSLYALNSAENYLIIFWSSTCGHCLEELPKVKELLDARNDIQIIAIGLEDNDANWARKIKEFPKFTHVLGLQKWDNPVSKAYGVNRTPTYFFLNSNKEITAKPDDFESLKEILK